MRAPLLVVTLALVAAPALAQSSSDRVLSQARLGGDAPSVCRIDGASAVSLSNAQFVPQSDTAGQILVSQLVDPITSVPRPVRVSLVFAAVCNHSHLLSVRSVQGGLTRDGGPVSGPFAARVGYQLGARWAGQARSADVQGQAAEIRIPVIDGSVGTIELELDSQGGGQPLAAGRYQDQVVVEFFSAS